ncbi:MAG: hypothetical protein Q4A32_02190 [Lachnospiraceae bacterium]|nr:hypothetical protein [Lachnospiraceae bacterium]
MKYIVLETAFRENEKRTAGAKARMDIMEICMRQAGYVPLEISFDTARFQERNIAGQIGEHGEALREWEMKTDFLGKGDLLVIQFPPINHSLMLPMQLGRLKKRGVHLVAILHDVEILRGAKRKDKSLKNRMRKHFEEKLCLGYFDRIVVHNKAMKAAIAASCGIPAGRLRSLSIFDYLCGEPKIRGPHEGVAIAGNLRPDKAGYAYQLPGGARWNLYGIQFSGKAYMASPGGPLTDAGVYYYGSFPAEEIAGRLEGSFGLIWDGPELDGCSGVFGDYLRYNDPHKASLYLAAGMPVFIWRDAALAGFILHEKAGIAVDSIRDIPNILEDLSDEEYHILALHAQTVGKRLRGGYYTRKVLETIERDILPE